jgi:predicted Zn-dependent peptidase
VPDDELSKARNYSKGRFVFSTETPQGLITLALSDEVLLGRIHEPDDVLAEIDAVTAEDVQRVAGDLLEGGLYLSIIGPFDEPGRFERLIA